MEYTNTRQRTRWRDEIRAFAGAGWSTLAWDRRRWRMPGEAFVLQWAIKMLRIVPLRELMADGDGEYEWTLSSLFVCMNELCYSLLGLKHLPVASYTAEWQEATPGGSTEHLWQGLNLLACLCECVMTGGGLGNAWLEESRKEVRKRRTRRRRSGVRRKGEDEEEEEGE